MTIAQLIDDLDAIAANKRGINRRQVCSRAANALEDCRVLLTRLVEWRDDGCTLPEIVNDAQAVLEQLDRD